MEKNKNLTVVEKFNLAVKHHKDNDLKVAENFYLEILEIEPNHNNALNNLGAIFTTLGDHYKAKECYEKAIGINSNFTDAHYNLGIAFQGLDENQKAKECYEKTIEIDPNYLKAHNSLGVLFFQLKEYPKATSCFERAIEIDPNFADIYNNFGGLLHEIGDYQKAISCFEKAIEINPNFLDSHNNLGVTLNELGNNQKAISCFERAIEIDSNYVLAHYNYGNLFYKLGEHQKAMGFYEKVIMINPNNLNAHNSLGLSCKKLGLYDDALKHYKKVYEIDSEHNATKNLFILLSSIPLSMFTKTATSSLKNIFLSLFRKNDISHMEIFYSTKSLIFLDADYSQIKQILNSNFELLTNKIVQKFIKEELIHLMLKKTIIMDELLEKFFTKIRCEILFTLENSDTSILKEHLNLITSLAEQCWLNEYIWFQSEKEIDFINKLRNKVESNKEIDELEVAILGCHIPLNRSEIIKDKLSVYKSKNTFFNNLVTIQIKEPLKEVELLKSIKSLDTIIDSVSKKVREQYEEHPFPRWKYLSRHIPQFFLKYVNIDIQPNKIAHNDKFKNPSVLIAGCGTGSHAIKATRINNAKILAIDLSLTSLTYAKRKSEELNIKNIEFLHADILQLKKLNKRFDIIESSGTLHHMRDPMAGLEILTDILEPHGLMSLGLYSKLARRQIRKARELIINKNFKNTIRDIKDVRELIIDKKKDLSFEGIVQMGDFYSTSNVRDLLFHVQEHCFTLPDIVIILKKLNLEFLGFTFQNPLVKKAFLTSFPNDKNLTSLDNWHKFETENPHIFISMYQFWVQKNKKHVD